MLGLVVARSSRCNYLLRVYHAWVTQGPSIVDFYHVNLEFYCQIVVFSIQEENKYSNTVANKIVYKGLMYNKALRQLVLTYCSKGKFQNPDFQRFLDVLYVLKITNTAALCVNIYRDMDIIL